MFQTSDVAPSDGDNAFTPTTSDTADNTAQPNLTIALGKGTVSTDVALQSNQQALDAIRLTVVDPPPAPSALAMVSLAQYDTLATIDGAPAYLVHEGIARPVSVDMATPPWRWESRSAAASLRSGPTMGPHLSIIPEARMWACCSLQLQSSEVASEPQWDDATPFDLTSDDGFHPLAPWEPDSAEYAQSENEVQNQSADHTEIAQQVDLSSSLRLSAELNLALDDSGTYDSLGPIDAMHGADQDGTAVPTANPNFRTPLRITPSFSKSTSVHSKFSAAAGTVLAAVAAAVERLSLRPGGAF